MAARRHSDRCRHPVDSMREFSRVDIERLDELNAEALRRLARLLAQQAAREYFDRSSAARLESKGSSIQ